MLTACTYLFFFTNLPQRLYMSSIRNLPFECLQFVAEPYIYKAKPEACRADNIEYSTIATHGSDGFRNPSERSHYVAAVLGDSHAYGFGVGDDETFSALLDHRYHFPTRNLAIGSFATARELEVFKLFGTAADYVVVQYCDNDFGENKAFLQLSEEQFRASVENSLGSVIANYRAGKAMGYKKPLMDLAHMLRNGSYMRKSVWRSSSQRRPMEEEAAVFSKIIDRYRPFLEHKKMLVFESAGYGLNAIGFARAFQSELGKLGWLRYKVVDSTGLLSGDDYYFFDDHLNKYGHQKLAAAIYRELKDW